MLVSQNSLPLFFVAASLFACAPGASSAPEPVSKEEARALTKADDATDWCELLGWYGDGICDDFCLEPDPDCSQAAVCAEDVQPLLAGELLVAIEDGGAMTLDPTTGHVRHSYATGPNAFGAFYSSDGTRAFVTDKNAGTLSEIDRSSDRILASIVVGSTPQQGAVTSDGRMYIPLSGEASIAVVDTSGSLSVLRKISTGAGSKPHIVALSPDERSVWATVQGIDPKVVRLDLTPDGEAPVQEYRYDIVPRVITATNDGAYFTGHHSTGLHFVNRADGKVSTPYMDVYGAASEARKQIEGVTMDPTGSLIGITHEGRKALVALGPNAAGQPIKLLDVEPLSASPYWVTFDPSGRGIYVSIPGSGDVLAYDLCTGRRLWKSRVGGKPKRMAAN